MSFQKVVLAKTTKMVDFRHLAVEAPAQNQKRHRKLRWLNRTGSASEITLAKPPGICQRNYAG